MVSVDEATLDAARSGAPRRHRRQRRRRFSVTISVIMAVVVLAAAGVGIGLGVSSGGPPGPPPPSLGVTENRAVPASALSIPLVDQHGRATSLATLAGHIVVLTPFMTSCQETCPITTGAFLQMRRAVRAVGLGGAVRFVEISVDPGRDVPSRMAAYARLTGATWPLLTGTPADLAALWRYFGVFYKTVPEDDPPGVDWQTGRPYTYDVDHSDGFIVLDGRSHERFATASMPRLGVGRLESSLTHMLSDEGRSDLAHPGPGAWTVPEGLGVIAWVAGRAVPAVP